jgi:hypothetical protein
LLPFFGAPFFLLASGTRLRRHAVAAPSAIATPLAHAAHPQ